MKSTVRISLASLLASLFCMVTVSGHLCVINPAQRGSMTGLNKAGSPDCILPSAPCGGRPTGGFITEKGGSNYTVYFQKNLDHYVKATPGYFCISFSADEGSTFKEAARIPDKGEPSLHIYSTSVTLPAAAKTESPHQIMQVVYKTNNPAAPPAFYQCADFIVY